MVVDVFVTEGDGVDSLDDEVVLRVGDVSLIARIVDDLIDTFGESDCLVGEGQEDGSGVGSEFTAVEVDVDGLHLGDCGGGGVVVHCVLVVYR